MIVNPGSYKTYFVSGNKKGVVIIDAAYIVDDEFYESLAVTEMVQFAFDVEARDLEYNVVIESENVSFRVSDKKLEADLNGKELYNANGLKVTSKGIFGEEHEYDDDIRWVLIVENNGTKTVTVDDKYMDDTGRFNLNEANLITYSHGRYYTLGEQIDKFGHSVRKKK